MKKCIFKKVVFGGVISLLFFFSIFSPVAAQSDKEGLTSRDDKVITEGERYIPGEVLVKFKEGRDPQLALQKINLKIKNIERIHSIAPVVNRLKKDYKLEKDSDGWYWFLGKKYKEINQVEDEQVFREAYKKMSPQRQGLYRKYKIVLPEGVSVEEAVRQLRNNPDVEYAYPNYIREMLPAYFDEVSNQWALSRIEAPRAWGITAGSPEVAIAVIDSGVDYNHEDIAANIWINKDEIPNNGRDDDGNGYVDDYRGYDFVSASDDNMASGEDSGPPDNDPMDFMGHGTHCSGIAAAVKGNQVGIAGVAPSCKIMALRAGYLTKDYAGYLDDSDISKAILYAIDNGAKVISMSFGGSEPETFSDELNTAYSENIVLVAAAGNDNNSAKYYPAAMEGVIAVASTGEADTKSSFSNYGDWIDVAAPGEAIYSTLPNNDYGYHGGTSMACPHVSGMAALIFSANSSLTSEEVCKIIQFFSDDLDPAGKDEYFGYGRVNAYSAVKAASGFRLAITSPAAGSRIKGRIDISGSAAIGGGFKKYELYYAPSSDPRNTTLINSSTTQVQNGLLGRLDSAGCIKGAGILTLKLFTTSSGEFDKPVNVIVEDASPPFYGDVSGDGKITAYDAALTAQASVGLITLTSQQITAADVSGNGQVSGYDAALIAQYAVGLITRFPVEG